MVLVSLPFSFLVCLAANGKPQQEDLLVPKIGLSTYSRKEEDLSTDHRSRPKGSLGLHKRTLCHRKPMRRIRAQHVHGGMSQNHAQESLNLWSAKVALAHDRGCLVLASSEPSSFLEPWTLDLSP